MQTTRRSILFPGDDVSAPIDEVGGKACSLLRLCRAGLPVPPGCVLTTAFFELWSASIRETTAWHVVEASGGVVPASCIEALQNHCQSLPYSPAQQKVLEQSLRQLPNRSGVWVVRSSSPAEDRGEASSAGLYRTEIGVPTEALCDAIRNVFASSFEERVFAYQRRKGHTTSLPQMAVIVQEAVPADVAGIAFSSNPVSNSHQEVVINAGWGLGESIVSGRVSPDELVLAKHGAAILDRKMGGKETALFLLPGGGVRECHGYRSGRFCLEEEDAVALRDLTLRVEELYGCPVDVEWASLNGEMLLLQARPVTTMVPLPEALRTTVDTPARMYLDLTLVEHGMQGALSPLGSSWMDLVLGFTLESLTAHPRLGRDAVTGIGQVVDGRMYLNISNLMWVMKPWMISLIFGGLDAYSAAIIRSADPGQWRTSVRPPLLSGILAASLRHSRDLFFHAARGFLLPETVAHECRASTGEFLRALDDLDSQGLSFAEYCRQAGRLIVWWVKEKTGSTLITSECARMVMRGMFAGAPGEVRALADRLDRALPNNRTTEMALCLSRLSSLAGPAVNEEIAALEERIRQKAMPDAFMTQWNLFMKLYGFRGPGEIDPASPGYAGEPRLLLAQMRTYRAASQEGQGPIERFAEEQSRREEAYRLLREFCRKKGRLWERLFIRTYTLIDTFGGIREDHKYYLVLVTSRVRTRALAAGERLASRNQIARAQDVFCLSVSEIQSALDDPGMRMQSTVANNRAWFARMNRCRRYPPVIDSTGRILHPPLRGGDDGDIRGYGVSSGTARGPARVLHHPAEKEVHPGDILVISASDPGWTPLFLTAGGVILEVGGLLQHGSIIAREYGIPCVVGVPRATEIIDDGQWVEIDGESGTVRYTPHLPPENDSPENDARLPAGTETAKRD